jgi:hypothetical protein
MPKSFLRSRSLAFARQACRCYYCTSPMWVDNPQAFAREYRLTLAQAMQFKCTGEHLVALQDGGNHSEANVVAACRFCNLHRHRHRPKAAPSPGVYKQRVLKRMKKVRWLGAQLFRASPDDDDLIPSTIHSAKGQEWKSVQILNIVDGRIPSDMSTGTPQPFG